MPPLRLAQPWQCLAPQNLQLPAQTPHCKPHSLAGPTGILPSAAGMAPTACRAATLRDQDGNCIQLFLQGPLGLLRQLLAVRDILTPGGQGSGRASRQHVQRWAFHRRAGGQPARDTLASANFVWPGWKGGRQSLMAAMTLPALPMMPATTVPRAATTPATYWQSPPQPSRGHGQLWGRLRGIC